MFQRVLKSENQGLGLVFSKNFLPLFNPIRELKKNFFVPFGSYSWLTKRQFRFDGTTTAIAASSNHSHAYTSLGKLSSGLVAASGYTNSVAEVELFSAHAWSRQPDFPASSRFYHYSTATVADALYLFGKYPKLITLLRKYGF